MHDEYDEIIEEVSHIIGTCSDIDQHESCWYKDMRESSAIEGLYMNDLAVDEIAIRLLIARNNNNMDLRDEVAPYPISKNPRT